MKPKKKNDSGTTFRLYSPKYFTLIPTEHLLINAKVSFEQPDGLRATVVTLTSLLTARIKSYQKTN